MVVTRRSLDTQAFVAVVGEENTSSPVIEQEVEAKVRGDDDSD